MEKHNDRISQLYKRWIENRETAEEAAELAKLTGDPANEAVFSALMEKEWDSPPGDSEFDQQKRLTMAHEIAGRYPHNDQNDEEVSGTRFRTILPIAGWRRYAAAAILLLLAGGAVYFLSNSRSGMQPHAKQDQATAAPQPDPQKPGVTLTLSDGRTITLDSLNSSVIALEEGAKLELGEGKLVYNSRGEPSPSSYNTMATPNGKQFNLVLSDGSRVWLNAGSSIRFPTVFSGTERRVEMTGEAYFEVAKLEGRPFRVMVGNAEIEVRGTNFNVNAYRDENNGIAATLLEGSVLVRTAKNNTFIKPGQQAQVSENDRIVLESNPDIEEVMAWKNGFFYFKNADLRTMTRQLARWYDVEFEYEGNIPVRSYEGKVERSLRLDDVLELLSKHNILSRKEGRKIILTSKD